jgi:hypothetical protein
MKKIKHDRKWYDYNSCGVGVMWTRYDSMDVCVQKTSDFLNDFVKLYPAWVPFKIFSTVKSSFTSYSEVPPLHVLRNIIEEGIDKVAYGYGHRVFFQNDVKSSEQTRAIYFHLTCGAYDRQSNGLSISFPPYNEDVKHIVTKDFFLSCFELIIKHWNPYRGCSGIPFSMITDYAEVDDVTSINFPAFGWLNYLSDKLGELPELPDWTIITPVGGLGNYIKVTEELPDKTKEKELHDIITKVYELSDIIEAWIKPKWEFIIKSGL